MAFVIFWEGHRLGWEGCCSDHIGGLAKRNFEVKEKMWTDAGKQLKP